MSALFGLVLSGGKSTRMGRDKGSIIYEGGIDQRARCFDLLAAVCSRVFVSCRREQEPLLPPLMPRILDERLGDSPPEGPAAGILAAFHAHRGEANAWFVLACDFPYVDAASIEHLLSRRSRARSATCYVHADGTPEPLFAIWERAALEQLEAHVVRNRLSPREALESLSCVRVPAPVGRALVNVNS